MFGHDIIVIGASAGGVEARLRLIGSLPVDLPASIFIVLHVPAQGQRHVCGRRRDGEPAVSN